MLVIAGRIISGAANQAGLSASLKQDISSSLASLNALGQKINSSNKLAPQYQSELTKIEENKKAWLLNPRFPDRDETNNNVYYDSYGVPFKKNGQVLLVIGNKIPSFTGENSEIVNSAMIKFDKVDKAAYDALNRRVFVEEWFAKAVLAGAVQAKDVNGNWTTFKMEHLAHHEFGHSSSRDTNANGGTVAGFSRLDSDAYYNLGAEVLEQIGQKAENIGTSRSENYGVRGPHGYDKNARDTLGFRFKDAAGVFDVNTADPADPNIQRYKDLRSSFGAPSLGGGTSVFKDGNGSLYIVKAGGELESIAPTYSGLGAVIGSSVGRYLTRNDGAIAQVAAATALGAIGDALGDVLDLAGRGIDLSSRFELAFSNFDQTLFNSLKAAGIGSLTAFTTMELGKALGIGGFGAELFNTTASTVQGAVLQNLASGHAAFDGFNLSKIFGADANLGNIVGPALGAFFGAKLGSLIISPTTTAGAALSSLGSAAGAYLAGTVAVQTALGISAASQLVANFVLPGVGAFVGFVLGALVGKLFGKKKPRVPTASAEIALNLDSTVYELGAVTVANNGNRDLVTNMATTAVGTLNELINTLVGGAEIKANANSVSVAQAYGHYGNQIRAKFANGAWQNFASADQAVEWGVMNAIDQTKIRGGDILFKRAILQSPADTLTAMIGDLQVAADYKIYSLNREAINGLIDADPRSAFSAAWIVTLGRANELGLNRFQASDFYGGLGGFLNSFGFDRTAVPDLAYENIDFHWEGGPVSVSVRSGAPGQDIFSLLPTASTDGRVVTIDSLASIGYRVGGAGNMSTGNDFADLRGATGGVVLDDTSYTYGEYGPIAESGGDDIFNGSNYNDQLYGQAGWDWLSGEAGNDYLDGGENDDVLLGGAGVDYLIGGAGSDYLAGGDGNDHEQTWIGGPAAGGLHGGDGNDTLIGGAGSDTLFGENGDDTLLVDADWGTTWDHLDGGPGLDTASYERLEYGVAIDMRSNRPSPASTVLGSGQYLLPGQSRTSPDGRFQLVYQGDGNLVFYGPAGAIWGSGTENTAPGRVWMQAEGNLVIYNAANQPIWATSGGGNPGAALYVQNTGRIGVFGSDQPELWTSDTGARNPLSTQATPSLAPGARLYPSQEVHSPNNQYHLKYQGDGNLVLYNSVGQPIWATDTAGTSAGFAVMQAEGNLVIYNAANQAVWGSSNGGSPGSGLFLQDSGRISVFGAEPRELWGTLGNPLGSPSQAYASLDPGQNLYAGQSVSSPDGRYVLAYQGDGNLVLYGPSGAVWGAGTEGTAPGRVAMQTAGNLVVYDAANQVRWASGNGSFPGARLFVRDSGRVSIQGTDGAEVFALATGSSTGYAARIFGDGWYSIENVTGTRYNDVLAGDEGGNVLRGLGGNDVLQGNGGDDVLEGGLGADRLDGGGGSDTASYEGSSSGVIVDLSTGLTLGGDASGDTLANIENLRGSKFDDELTGTTGNNVVEGLAGDDTILLNGGNDIIRGGDGFDTIDASAGTGTLFLTGPSSLISVSGQGVSSYTSIERFVGTAQADNLTGAATDETFELRGGNDYVNGNGGSDTFVFGIGDGQDTIDASAAGDNAIVIRQEGLRWGDLQVLGANYGQQNGNLFFGTFDARINVTVAANFSYVNSGTNAGQHSHKIKTLNLGGGSAVDISGIDWSPAYAIDNQPTTVYGAQNKSDIIFAYMGNDTLYAAGNATAYEIRGNVIFAGDGNDTIYGSAGDDQYIFERGNNQDTLSDSGGLDTIIMGPSVAADDVIYQVVSNDLYIGVRDLNNPTWTASQVADRIRIVGGGAKLVDSNSGAETLNTIEYVRVAGQEIDLTKANIDWTTGYYYGGGYYPIALDLDGDGIELRSVEGSRIVSVEQDGVVARLGWLGQDDGFLALDRNADGVIDRLSEISFAGDIDGAKSDLEGLAAHDSDGNGALDSSDARWGEFRVWQDKNQDGFGSADELVGLDAAGIRSIGLNGTATGFTTADGIDNAVLATTDVAWTDPERTGRGYDVVLARLQVRTDEGGRELTEADSAARGKAEADPLNAKLVGVQTLAEDEAAALKARRTDKGEPSDGRFYRAETILGSGAAVERDGAYTIDQEMLPVAAARGGGDAFAASEWTALGKIERGPAAEFINVPIVAPVLSNEDKALFDEARREFDEKEKAAEAAAAERAAKDAEEAAAAQRDGTMPMPDEPAKPTRTDAVDPRTNGPAEKGDDTRSAGATTDLTQGRGTSEPASVEPVQPAPSPTAEEPIAADQQREDLASHSSFAEQKPEAAGEAKSEPMTAANEVDGADQSFAARESMSDSQISQGARNPTAADEPKDDAGSSDVSGYGVRIAIANARLVQALASFGEAPVMMADYQGLNVANDAQASWLSVDALPSVQRMASV